MNIWKNYKPFLSSNKDMPYLLIIKTWLQMNSFLYFYGHIYSRRLPFHGSAWILVQFLEPECDSKYLSFISYRPQEWIKGIKYPRAIYKLVWLNDWKNPSWPISPYTLLVKKYKLKSLKSFWFWKYFFSSHKLIMI